MCFQPEQRRCDRIDEEVSQRAEGLGRALMVGGMVTVGTVHRDSAERRAGTVTMSCWSFNRIPLSSAMDRPRAPGVSVRVSKVAMVSVWTILSGAVIATVIAIFSV